MTKLNIICEHKIKDFVRFIAKLTEEIKKLFERVIALEKEKPALPEKLLNEKK